MTSTASVSTSGYTSTAIDTSDDTIIIVAKSDLAITLAHDEGDHYQSGQKIVYQLNTQNVAGAGPVTAPDSVVVTFVIPVGLRHIQVVGYDWNVITSSDMSPTLITATYFGTYPVLPGQVLPPLSITGQLTTDASPHLTTTAVVGALNDANPANNVVYDTVFVARRKSHGHDQHHQSNNRYNDNDSNGKDGENGKDGRNGENGKDGKDSRDGKDGENGKDGKDGKNSSSSLSSPSWPETGGGPIDTKL